MMQTNNPSYPHIARELEQNSREKSTIIDAGCGHNEFKNTYNQKIMGLDVVFNVHADFIADGQALPIKDSRVNIFLSNFVLEHVENQASYLSELRRALHKNGKIILSVPTPLWYIAHLTLPHTLHNIIKEFPKFLHTPLKFLTHGHPHKHTFLYEFFEWGCKNYEAMFKSANLKVVRKFKTCNFFSLNAHFAKIFSKINFPNFLNVHVTYILEKN